MNNFSIRRFLWCFYGLLVVWLCFPELLSWLAHDNSFRGPIVFGIGIGIAVPIVEVMRGNGETVHDISMGYLFFIVGGLALLALAYVLCRHYGISVEAFPPGRAARPIQGLFGGGAAIATAGVTLAAISRFWRKQD
jgi:hypothetical protein